MGKNGFILFLNVFVCAKSKNECVAFSCWSIDRKSSWPSLSSGRTFSGLQHKIESRLKDVLYDTLSPTSRYESYCPGRWWSNPLPAHSSCPESEPKCIGRTYNIVLNHDDGMIHLVIQIDMKAIAQEGDGPTPGHRITVVQHQNPGALAGNRTQLWIYLTRWLVWYL